MTNSAQTPGQAVADTGVLVAAIRAEETRRTDGFSTTRSQSAWPGTPDGMLAAVREQMQRSGAPWLFGSDAPQQLCERWGWSAVVTDVAEPGNKWGRWFAPAVPLDVPGVPRGYFVVATKS